MILRIVFCNGKLLPDISGQVLVRSLPSVRQRILKDYIDGKTAYELVLQNEMKPEYIEQIREMCRLLNPKGINIDYFPTNFVVQDGLLYYVDYECNQYMEEWNMENWGIKYWRRTAEFEEYLENHT